MSVEAKVLELFNAMVVTNPASGRVVDVANGYVTDFIPTAAEAKLLLAHCKPLPIITLFSRQEREEGNLLELLTKQVLHYIEVYGFNQPGTFNLEAHNGSLMTLTKIRGIDENDLGVMMRKLLYANAPIKDVVAVAEIIKHYRIDFNINEVANNEARCALFDANKHKFNDGDDVVRYICYLATGKTMLIKSKEVLTAVKSYNAPINMLLENHAVELAAVFNRHKRILLSLKGTTANNSIINRISRLSKSKHIPLGTAGAKTFIADYLADRDWSSMTLSLRDKFKILNKVLEMQANIPTDMYLIRNGRVWTQPRLKNAPVEKLQKLKNNLLVWIARDLYFLHGKVVLLDNNVDYGLPVSRKQTIGHLPYGTKISVDTSEISSGIYWHEVGGASDLDLSTIDVTGERTGWGGGRGYTATDIIFSGDITSAYNGAMEFMTSKKGVQTYGLFVNVFTGDSNHTEMELVVGTRSPKNKQWIDDCIVREKHTLNSRGNLLGFVKNGVFEVYGARLNDAHISSPKEEAIVKRGLVDRITIKDLFDECGVVYYTAKTLPEGVAPDYDLSYNGFTYDKLESLFRL